MVPSAEHPKLFVILCFNPAVGQKLNFHASRTASSSSCPKSAFPAQSSLVLFFFSHPPNPLPTTVPPVCFVTSNPLQGSVSGDGTVVPLSPCRVDVLFAFPGDPFRPLSGSALCLLYKQPRLGQKTWLLVLGMLCLRPAAPAGLSDRARHFANCCGIYIIRWQKWFTETGQVITVTSQIHSCPYYH